MCRTRFTVLAPPKEVPADFTLLMPARVMPGDTLAVAALMGVALAARPAYAWLRGPGVFVVSHTGWEQDAAGIYLRVVVFRRES